MIIGLTMLVEDDVYDCITGKTSTDKSQYGNCARKKIAKQAIDLQRNRFNCFLKVVDQMKDLSSGKKSKSVFDFLTYSILLLRS